MKFTWKHRYGPKSEKHGTWAVDCYLMGEKTIKIATINLSGSFEEFKSSVNKFHVEIINCDDMGITNRHYFSDTLGDLKKLVEEKYEKLKEVLNRVK